MVDRKTLRQVSEELKTRIAQGLYAPGQRLLEKDLVEEYGVSRGRMREVLRNLVGEGLLEFEEQRGVRIRRLDRKDATDLGRLREMIEGLAARLAAERMPDAELERQLVTLGEQMDQTAAASDAETYGHLNREFHDLIVRAADNALLATTLDRLRVPLFRLQFVEGLRRETLEERNGDHQAITRAILSGDGDAAEAAMRCHVRGGNARLAALADRLFL
ncbi:hypothetical protein PK98_02350 [Croceibacterium mercuriale]|uniref:HTH gntR-type domain-containing protein n=1 Tax=Croceibacterium mercuriale TaxID=1572751 RepID=A0A0B2BVQ9_9SPHN|nr:GntR family transcriptional regulator [Croceibacterium mercuriale]KHL25539.1 hypothetical protein PK98_02350 [Croceibacterium mercuriale]